MLGYRIKRLVGSVRTSFWFWPIAFIILAVCLASTISRTLEAVSVPQSAEALGLARSAEQYAGAILTTTAVADITILTFVFSTFMVVLQLAGSQLSPRILRTIVRDGSAQVSMAIMVGGFVFSMYALMSVYGATNPLVPATLVMVALLWMIVVVFTFLRFVAYTISRIRAPAVIRSVADTTAQSIKRTFNLGDQPANEVAPEYEVTSVIEGPRDGILTGLDMRDLSGWAERRDALVVLDVGLGDHVSAGVPIGRVHSKAPLRSSVVARFTFVERERTLRGDPPYGFRLLVDIAIRALSPAVNDPTTAVQVLDELESLLVLLTRRPEQAGHLCDADGTLRLVAPVMRWRTYLRLAVQEIYEYGRESSQVTQRIARMLDALATVVSGERLEAVMALRERIVVIPPIIESEPGVGAEM